MNHHLFRFALKEKKKYRWEVQKLDTNHSLLSLSGFTDSEGNVLDFIVDEAGGRCGNRCPCGDGGQAESRPAFVVGQ